MNAVGDYRELIATLIALAGVITLGWVALGLAIRLVLVPLASLVAWLAVTVQP